MIELAVEGRGTSAADVLRDGGFVPAVLYGRLEKATPIAIDARALEKVWKEAGQTAVVTLTGVGDKKDTLIKDVQVHPVSGRLIHADFYALEKGKKIKISVPLVFMGEAPAEKAGHILVKAMHAVEIEVEPKNLPHDLPVDLSKLENVGDHILASQISLPQSATLITHGDDTVVSVTAFVEEKEAEPVVPAPEGEVAVAASAQQPGTSPEGEKAPAA